MFYTIPLISNDTIKNTKICPHLQGKKKIRRKMQFSQTNNKYMGKLSNSLEVKKKQISFLLQQDFIFTFQTSKFSQTKVPSIIIVWIKQLSVTVFQNVLSSFSQLKNNKNKNQEHLLNSCSMPNIVPVCPYSYPQKHYELTGNITAFQKLKLARPQVHRCPRLVKW